MPGAACFHALQGRRRGVACTLSSRCLTSHCAAAPTHKDDPDSLGRAGGGGKHSAAVAWPGSSQLTAQQLLSALGPVQPGPGALQRVCTTLSALAGKGTPATSTPAGDRPAAAAAGVPPQQPSSTPGQQCQRPLQPSAGMPAASLQRPADGTAVQAQAAQPPAAAAEAGPAGDLRDAAPAMEVDGAAEVRPAGQSSALAPGLLCKTGSADTAGSPQAAPVTGGGQDDETAALNVFANPLFGFTPGPA